MIIPAAVASVSSPLSLPKPASTRSHIRHPLCLPKPLPLLSPPSPPLSLYEVASMVVCWMFDGLRNNAGGYGATSERWIEEASATNLRLRRWFFWLLKNCGHCAIFRNNDENLEVTYLQPPDAQKNNIERSFCGTEVVFFVARKKSAENRT